MNLYLVTYAYPVGWDEYIGFVIQAPDVLDAKIQAADKAARTGQGRVGWKAEKIGTAVGKRRRIVLESFNAG